MRPRAWIAIAIAATGCKQSEPAHAPVHEAHGSASPTVPPPPPIDAAPPRVDELIAYARARADKRLGLASLQASYVRSDGSLDPTYGALELEYLPPPPPPPGKPPDDPRRPTGAPLPPPERPVEAYTGECPSPKYADGVWSWTDGMCMGRATLPLLHCTVAELWTRALAREAPTDALAVIRIGHQGGDDRPIWSFTITDEPRDVHIELSIPDDCTPVVERPR